MAFALGPSTRTSSFVSWVRHARYVQGAGFGRRLGSVSLILLHATLYGTVFAAHQKPSFRSPTVVAARGLKECAPASWLSRPSNLPQYFGLAALCLIIPTYYAVNPRF